jgi:BirA family biotin operon repressor/biotin-[acetyl-CoA-carboxylase] ligase
MNASHKPNVLNLAAIEGELTTRYLGRPKSGANELSESIASTNSRALELAKSGAASGTMILARQQTAGRGRLGRSWVSPLDSGIYASFILRPPSNLVAIERMTLYTLAAGVACVKAIGECLSVPIGLKWVNDLVIDGKKVGGILAEMPSLTVKGALDDLKADDLAIVLGIGINICFQPNEIPDELKPKIDWLEMHTESVVDKNKLLATCAKSIEECCEAIEQAQDQKLLAEWKQYSVTLGKQIRAVSGDTVIEGQAEDITDSGALIVRKSDGHKTILYAGEISIRQADGSYV